MALEPKGDFEKQLDGVLTRFSRILTQQPPKESQYELFIRLDDMFLKLKLWKQDIKISKSAFTIAVNRNHHMLGTTTFRLTDISEQLEAFEESTISNCSLGQESSGTTPEEAVTLLEVCVESLVSRVGPFRDLLRSDDSSLATTVQQTRIPANAMDSFERKQGLYASNEIAESLESMDYLLPKNIDDQDPLTGLTPLASATIAGDANKVKQLLKQGAKVDARSKDGETPLLLAGWKTTHNRARIIQLLLGKSPPVDASCPTARGSTSLMFVVQQKDLESIRLMRKAGASLTRKNDDGLTAAKLAEDTGDKAVILALTSAEEKSIFGRLAEAVVGFLLFVVAWVNSKANGAIRWASGLGPELDQRLDQESVENVDRVVKGSPLERFFKMKNDFIQDVARKATELENDSSTSLGCKDLLPKTINVSLHQQVIYCDDSSSMKRDRRWVGQEELVKRIAKITTRILPEGEGVALRFINQDINDSPNLTLEDIENIMGRTSWDPNGDTAIGTFLRSKILGPLVYSKLESQKLERPLLVSIITDGMPSKESNTAFVDAIVECGKKLEAAGYPRDSVKFMIGQVGTAPSSTKFLSGIRANTEIANVVFVTTDQLDAKFADLHENEKDLDRWLIETLFSPIKDRDDKKRQ